MKTIEFNPAGKPIAISPGALAADESARNEILLGVLPLVFHKLKNKLTPILGYTQILQSRGLDAFALERLARIERNTAELTESLNTLKEYCRPASGEMRPTGLNTVVEEMAPRWQVLATEAGARIVLELSAGLPQIPLQAGRLRILLLSLAENAACALKEKPAGGREIRVSTRADGPALLLAVRDNGCGMSEEEAASCWMPFFSRFPGRAGLGLVLCEKVIADHGAACTIASTMGEFCQFTIAFPRRKPGSEAAKMSAEANSLSQS